MPLKTGGIAPPSPPATPPSSRPPSPVGLRPPTPPGTPELALRSSKAQMAPQAAAPSRLRRYSEPAPPTSTSVLPSWANPLEHSLQHARLANEVYEDYPPGKPGQCTVQGWEDKSFDEATLKSLGLTQAMLKSDSKGGFRARVYVPQKGSGLEHMPPTVIFMGTSPKSGSDIGANMRQGTGGTSEQYDQAVAIGRAMRGKGAEVVGHSLGGGLASAASLAGSLRGTTFNAAGLHDKTIERMARDGGAHLDAKVVAFHSQGEALGSLQRKVSFMPEAVGVAVSVPGASGKISLLERGKRHGMGDMLARLEEQVALQNPTLHVNPVRSQRLTFAAFADAGAGAHVQDMLRLAQGADASKALQARMNYSAETGYLSGYVQLRDQGFTHQDAKQRLRDKDKSGKYATAIDLLQQQESPQWLGALKQQVGEVEAVLKASRGG